MALRSKKAGSAGPSLLQRIDEFERRRRGNGAGASDELIVPQAPPAHDAGTVLPEGWTEPYLHRPSAVRKWAFRWTVLALLVAVGVTVALAIGWYLSIAEEEALDVRAGYRQALVKVEQALPGGEAAMVAITQPETTAEQLVLDLAPFTAFQGAVTTLSSRVRADLPDTPPFAPRDALEELEPLRSDLALAAGRADALSARLGKLVTYRLVFAEMFALPELPLRATANELDLLSPALAQATADSVQGLSRLPADDFLDEHRTTVQETIDFLRDWQPGYISALQAGDRQQAELLMLRLNGQLRDVRTGIEGPLDAFRTWAESEFAGLRRDVGNALILVGPAPAE